MILAGYRLWDKMIKASGLIWLATAAGCGVVVGDDGPREVAYHRLCCRQDDSVALGAHSEFGSTLEHIIQQFDSDLCVHDIGVGTTAPREQKKNWPHVTLVGTRAFKTKYIAPWFKRRAGRASRERSSRGRGSRSSHGGRSRSSSRDRSELNMKCATVEVFLQNRFPHKCPFQLFTPSYIADIARQEPEIQIGTGQGKLSGENIVDYVQDERHMKKQLPHFGEGAALKPIDCDSIISTPMIASAVNGFDALSLDAEGVVRFMEYATNSRAPTSNIYVQKDELKDVLTVKKLEKLNVVDAVKRLCKKMGVNPQEHCLKEVPLELLTRNPKVESRSSGFSLKAGFALPKIDLFTSAVRYNGLASEDPSSRKTVDLSELMNKVHWNAIVKAIRMWWHRPNESRICEYSDGARLMDFVLMRAFLAVSGTAYARLHDGAMYRRLINSSREHWMLAACASVTKIDEKVPLGSPFLDRYFRFKSDGLTRVTFREDTTLADISGTRSEDSSCAVLAGEHDLLDKPKPADGKVDLLIAYFYLRKGDKEPKVFRSHADRGDPWAFFGRSEDVDLRTVLKYAEGQLETLGQSPSWAMYE